MDVKEWTRDHILAETVAVCYTSQLRIERASTSVVHTSFKTRNDGPCKAFEKMIGNPLPGFDSEELVDGITAQIERSKRRAAAVHRVKLFSGAARSLADSVSEKKK